MADPDSGPCSLQHASTDSSSFACAPVPVNDHFDEMLSGIRPSNFLDLWCSLGALRNWKLQEVLRACRCPAHAVVCATSCADL